MLKLIRREELVFRGQNVGLSLLQEALIEARAGRKVVFEELVEEKWLAKGKTKETMSNFFDLQTRQAKDYVDGVAARIRRDLEAEENKSARLSANRLFKSS
jgi:hypothetical protein